MKTTDCLIIGSGIAGLSFALKIAARHPHWTILIVTKTKGMESNTRYAQGGIAAVWDSITDDFEKHIEDTLKAGKYLSDPEIVRMVVEDAPERVRELITMGVQFDTNPEGQLQLSLEGGHSAHRILHHKDFTGLEIEQKLWKTVRKQPNISVWEYYMAIDLLMNNDNGVRKVVGARVCRTKEKKTLHVHAKLTVLASGGIGQLFKHTTNPIVATADGLAMAIRAGASTRNLQYVQFHPTMLYKTDRSISLLISEALRGFGAHLLNHAAQRFMFQYDEKGELATRDIVSDAIFMEMKKENKSHQFLDCRHLASQELEAHFPFILKSCRQVGIDPVVDLIPIVPAAHYHCGGISVDKFACTSLPQLMALGECAETGLHGANRLASNSLLEALVFAHMASLKAAQVVELATFDVQKEEFATPKINPPKLKEFKEKLQETMAGYAVFKNSTGALAEALEEVIKLEEEMYGINSNNIAFQELQNMLVVAKSILLSAMEQLKNDSVNSIDKVLLPL
ncbi:L-aspartate oxidase [Marivirga sp. S37H4]|uniref:L-aspartate oxidase n=1 Tax=Marivirga aurantiaca TaxID=2802615 RepID=A0A935C5Q6_9BACT|nr:L-aspartate oxidase [Marivirga aurantiaca]MBK6263996.1 L-aspartate oxidase [Marivirga aurantiaca]